MGEPNLLIRIQRPGADGDMEWVVQWEHIPRLSFTDVLGVISRLYPNTTITAFDYLDEDRESITVRTDEEMAIMISAHIRSIRNSKQMKPLYICPKVTKSPKRRNVEGLKVQTKASNSVTESNVRVPHSASPIRPGSSKVNVGDIKKILSGTRIKDDDLVLVDILGTGNGGTVYKAKHKDSNAVVAVKVIPLDVTQDEQRQIMSELEILYKCHSPVIIEFYGAFFVENRISICTEFMDGGSLDKYGAIPEVILGRIAVSVVRGLQYLWSLKIMHRDVKPSNILVNTQGQIKLCDFGVSVQLENSIAQTYVGTNIYMAPERIEGKAYGIHSEVWSLGISLFEMAVGRFPYESVQDVNKPMVLLNCIVENESPLLPRKFFTENFVNFVSHCMHKDSGARPSPEALMYHPFILHNDDNNTDIVAQWTCSALQRLQQQQRLKQNTNSA